MEYAVSDKVDEAIAVKLPVLHDSSPAVLHLVQVRGPLALSIVVLPYLESQMAYNHGPTFNESRAPLAYRGLVFWATTSTQTDFEVRSLL